ncbi:MAG: hypothetical protein PHD99_04490 [Candidatus Moranbacteria bacterium]|nr:hypothetical protein [Candidatus Moranbacteria bacterium]
MNTTLFFLVPKVICPLMGESYRDELRSCNIPKTRAKLLEIKSTCCDSSQCFPLKAFPIEAKKEIDPPVQRSTRRLIYCNA